VASQLLALGTKRHTINHQVLLPIIQLGNPNMISEWTFGSHRTGLVNPQFTQVPQPSQWRYVITLIVC